MKLVFDTKGNEKQKLAMRHWIDRQTNTIVYGGSKMSGKSYLGCSAIFGDAYIYPDTHYFIARKNLNDLRRFTIPSIHEVFEHWGVEDNKYYSYNGQDNYFELYNKSRVYLLDAKYLPSDPEYTRYGSMQMTRGWIEEGGEFCLAAKNNLAATIGRKKNDIYGLYPKLLITCNPAHNFLYSDFYKKFKEGTLESYNAFIQALPTDNKMMTQEYYQMLERSLTTSQKQRLLFGKWEFDDSPEWLVDYDAICDLFTNDHVIATNEKYLSTDIALKGRDRFTVGAWEGLVVNIVKDKPFIESPDVISDIKEVQLKYGIAKSRSVFDADGLGSYISGFIPGMFEFHGGGTPFDKQFDKLKSQCGYKLAELINERKIWVICTEEQREKLMEELRFLRAIQVDNDTSKKGIMTKDKIKAELGWSPDYMDMLIMRMVFEFKQKYGGVRRTRTK